MRKAVTVKTLADQDWKTQLAQGYSNIPANCVVDVINEDYYNMYGIWCEVMWNNQHYYVSKSDLSFLEADIESAEQNSDEIYMYKDKFKGSVK